MGVRVRIVLASRRVKAVAVLGDEISYRILKTGVYVQDMGLIKVHGSSGRLDSCIAGGIHPVVQCIVVLIHEILVARCFVRDLDRHFGR